jgi:hypothetical protein
MPMTENATQADQIFPMYSLSTMKPYAWGD